MPRNRETLTGYAAARAYDIEYYSRPEVRERRRQAQAEYRKKNLEAVRKRDRDYVNRKRSEEATHG